MDKLNFIEWMEIQLEQKGWSRSDLARTSGISASHISRILNGEVSPSADYMVSIASALHVPPEEVFRVAGLLPPHREQPPGFLEWMDLFLSASEEQREELLAYARFQAERRRKKSFQSH
jgi:transcriptional regulator with XRE-family HTH domain